MTERFAVPPDLKVEFYERRRQTSSFDRLDFALELIPGMDGVGAIVRNFTDAIALHDIAVKNVEDKWLETQGLRHDFNRKNRLYRNFDSAWNTMNQNQAELDEYLALAPGMVEMEERIKRITDAKAKVKAESDWARFKEIEPRNNLLALAYRALLDSQERRNEARELLQNAERELVGLQEAERLQATKITDDHIVADEKGVNISLLFPNVQSNNILAQINECVCEDLPFDEIMCEIKRQPSPHLVVFRRYDNRYDPFRMSWFCLQDLRDMGVCIDDPMISKAEFVELAAKGDFDAVKAVLIKGEDPNSQDYTGATPLLAAAANRHAEVVELLFRAGARVDCRDKNMMTPLLSATLKGHLDIVRQLIDCGADKGATDRNHRNALYFAILSRNIHVAKYFLVGQNVNEPENLWGFAPLHTAANIGDLDMLKALVTHGASIYVKDNKNRTPETVAFEAGFSEVGQFLANERLGAPGQLVYRNSDIAIEIWVGDYASLDPKWSSDAGITEVICLPTIDSKPGSMDWLKDDETCKHHVTLVDVDDEDKTNASWTTLEEKMPYLVKRINDFFKRGGVTVLICDPSGNSTCITIVAVVLLLRYQTRIEETLANCGLARPSMKLSFSMRRGIETLQRTLDDKKLKRLAKKVQHSVILSSAF